MTQTTEAFKYKHLRKQRVVAENTKHTLITITLLIAIALFLTPTASAAPTQGDCIIATSSPYPDYAPVASISNDGHLAADTSVFSSYLYCNQTMVDWGRNANVLSYASAGAIAGSQQGHISEAGIFPNNLAGNWSQCQITAGTCSTVDGEACLVGVTSSGAISGTQQGHAVACGTGTHSICCCPSGSEWNPSLSQCIEFSSQVGIGSISGPSNPPLGTEVSYDTNVEWGWNSPVRVTFRFEDSAGNIHQQTTVTDSALNSEGTVFSQEVTFSAPDTYELIIEARLENEPSVNTSQTYTITVSDEFITTDLDGTTNAQVGDIETYTSDFDWGTTAGGITADLLVTVDGTTSTIDTFSASGNTGSAAWSPEYEFTQTGTHEICVQARHNNDPTVEDESCVDVNVLSANHVSITDYNTSDQEAELSTSYSYSAEIEWGENQGVEYELYTRLQGASYVGTRIDSSLGSFSASSGTQLVSWSTQYTQAGIYRAYVEAQLQNDATVNDSTYRIVTVGENIQDPPHCADVIPDSNSYTCLNPPPATPDTEDGRYNWTLVTELYCPGNEDSYCRTCGEGFIWNESEGDCQKETCEAGDELLYDECSAPAPLLVDLQTNVTSGPAHLSVLFDINITGAIDGVTYELDFDDGTPYSHTGWDPVTDDTTHTYETPKTHGIDNVIPYEATLTATDGEGRTNSSTVFINVTCIGSGYSGNPNLCCDGLNYGKGACWAPGQISGTVRVNYSDLGILLPQSANEVVVRIYNDTDEVNSTAVGTDGAYAFSDLIPDDYTVRASRPLSEQNQTVELNPGGTEVVDFVLQDPVYNSDCTNAQGRCDSNALGRNGCLMDPTDPDYDNRSQVLFACDRRLPGSQVTINQNGTHSLVGNCCSETPVWVETPPANIESNASNLIRYTRLTNYLGQPVNLVILTWN